ncbi:conserved Plasmodium protein, unknown function [Plasmodium vinckei brucechwatti]|uniref:Uncharacterized protein n=1 Tax=Plasmodium vinckei brucechwatti TaxID=119398 RepID=A0A6V7RT74_PLAVN|nr:conserved Plasmodium protein, unknown function [Plasmodium vinckei brucechwatti]
MESYIRENKKLTFKCPKGKKLYRYLDISLNNKSLHDHHILELVKILKNNIKITYSNYYCLNVDLSENYISCAGLKTLIKFILNYPDHIGINILKLYKNNIKDEGASLIKQAVYGQKIPIEELHLSHNFIQDDACKELLLSFVLAKRDANYIYPRYDKFQNPYKHAQQIPVWIRLEYNCIRNPKEILKEVEDCAKKKRGYKSNLIICSALKSDKRCCPYKCLNSTNWNPPIMHVYMFIHQKESIVNGKIVKDDKKEYPVSGSIDNDKINDLNPEGKRLDTDTLINMDINNNGDNINHNTKDGINGLVSSNKINKRGKKPNVHEEEEEEEEYEEYEDGEDDDDEDDEDDEDEEDEEDTEEGVNNKSYKNLNSYNKLSKNKNVKDDNKKVLRNNNNEVLHGKPENSKSVENNKSDENVNKKIKNKKRKKKKKKGKSNTEVSDDNKSDINDISDVTSKPGEKNKINNNKVGVNNSSSNHNKNGATNKQNENNLTSNLSKTLSNIESGLYNNGKNRGDPTRNVSNLPLYIILDCSAVLDMKELWKDKSFLPFSFPGLLYLYNNKLLKGSNNKKKGNSSKDLESESSGFGGNINTNMNNGKANDNFICLMCSYVANELKLICEKSEIIRQKMINLKLNIWDKLSEIGVLEFLSVPKDFKDKKNLFLNSSFLTDEQIRLANEHYDISHETLQMIQFSILWSTYIYKISNKEIIIKNSKKEINKADVKKSKKTIFTEVLYLTSSSNIYSFFEYLYGQNINLILPLCITVNQINKYIQDEHSYIVDLLINEKSADKNLKFDFNKAFFQQFIREKYAKYLQISKEKEVEKDEKVKSAKSPKGSSKGGNKNIEKNDEQLISVENSNTFDGLGNGNNYDTLDVNLDKSFPKGNANSGMTTMSRNSKDANNNNRNKNNFPHGNVNDPNLKNMYPIDEYKNGNFQIMNNLDLLEKRDFDINNVMLKGDTHGDGKVGNNNEVANGIQNNNSLENRDNASNMKGNKLSIYNLLVNAFNGSKKGSKGSGKDKRSNPTTVLGDESVINLSPVNNTSLNSNLDIVENINKDNKYIDHQSPMNIRNGENSDPISIANNNTALLSHLKGGNGVDNSLISTHNIRESKKGIATKNGNNVINNTNKMNKNNHMNKIEMMTPNKLGNENKINKSNSRTHSQDSRNNSSLIMNMNNVNNKKYSIHKNDIDGKLNIDMLNNNELELNNLLGTLPKNLNDNLSLYLENKRNNSSGILPNENGISHFNQKFSKLDGDNNSNNDGKVVMINKEEHQRFINLKNIIDTYRGDVLNTCLLLEELILNQAMCKYVPTELYNKILKCYERLDMMLTNINKSNNDMGMKRSKDINSLSNIGNLENMDYMNLSGMNNVNFNDMDIKMDENMLYEDFKSYWDMAFSKNKASSPLTTKDFHINDINNSSSNILNKNGTINNKNNIHINQLFYEQGHGNKISNNNHPMNNGGLNNSIKSNIGMVNANRGSTNMIGNNNINLNEMNHNNLGNSKMKSQKKKDSQNIMDTIINDNMNNNIGGCIGNSKSKKNSNDNDENNSQLNTLNENMSLNYNNLKNSSIMNKKKYLSNMNNNGGSNIDLVNFINSANNNLMKGNGMMNAPILNGNNNMNIINAKNNNTNYTTDINSKLVKELSNYNSMNKERSMSHIEESDIKAVNKLLMLNNNNFSNLKVNNNNDSILTDYSNNNNTNNIMINAEAFFKKMNLYNDNHNNNTNNKDEGIGRDSNLLSLINMNRNSKSSYNVNQKGDNNNLQSCNTLNEYDEPRDNNSFKKQLNNENHLYNMHSKNIRSDMNLKYLEEINNQFNFMPRDIRKESAEHNLMNILNFQNNLENKMQKQID